MIFFAAFADLPSPPPPAPPVATVATVKSLPAPTSVRHSCPLEGFEPNGIPCPHPALWGLAVGSDIPGQTLGSTDADYGRRLTAQFCEAKPWSC